MTVLRSEPLDVLWKRSTISAAQSKVLQKLPQQEYGKGASIPGRESLFRFKKKKKEMVSLGENGMEVFWESGISKSRAIFPSSKRPPWHSPL